MIYNIYLYTVIVLILFLDMYIINFELLYSTYNLLTYSIKLFYCNIS